MNSSNTCWAVICTPSSSLLKRETAFTGRAGSTVTGSPVLSSIPVSPSVVVCETEGLQTSLGRSKSQAPSLCHRPVDVSLWEEIVAALRVVILQALAVREVVRGEGEARGSRE